MYKLAMVLLLAIAVIACEKEKTKSCNNTAHIYFTNQGNSNGTLYLNDSMITEMGPGQSALYPVDTGWHQVRITGLGININEAVHLGDCQTMTFNFP